MFPRTILVFALLASPVLCEEASQIDHLRQQTIRTAQQLWSNASHANWTRESLMRGIEELVRPVRRLEEPPVSFYQKMSPVWESVDEESHGVNSMFMAFTHFLDQAYVRSLPERAYLDTADGLLQDTGSLQEIHETIVKYDTVYGESSKMSNAYPCQSKTSQQMLLYNIYTATQMTFLKAYVMAQSAWLIRDTYGSGKYKATPGDNKAKADNMTQNFQMLTTEQANLAITYLQDKRRDIAKCDPAIFREGENYAEVKGLLQGYLENEVDMNSKETCKDECSSYQVTQSYGCFKDKFCAVQPQCSGRIFNCQYFEPDMEVCIPSNQSSSRRYDYIHYKKGTVLGNARVYEACNLVTVNSWWRFFLPAHCTYCFCLCEELPSRSERYFSLGSSMSAVEHNKVVTGVRFKKVGDTFYLQVQQGGLLPRGGINRTTVEWVPVDTGAPRFLMSYEKRNMDLDDIQAPPGYVLTGMRFREIGSHLNPEIQVTPLDFDTGRLHRPNELSYWHGSDNTEHSLFAREFLKLPTTDVAFNSGPNLRYSSSNMYLEFGPSDIASDAAQTTVPLIDIQPVTTDPPSMLSGAGILHRGSSKMAGFVAPRIFTYNIAPHIAGDLTDSRRPLTTK